MTHASQSQKLRRLLRLCVGAALIMQTVSGFSQLFQHHHQQQQQRHAGVVVKSRSLSSRILHLQPTTTQQPSRSSILQQDSVWRLHEIIRADVWNADPFDIGQGGVRLAMENAVKISGTVQHKPGKAEAKPMELIRYRELQSMEESTVTKVLHEMKAELICMGQGKELYRDPGTTTVKEVVYGPHEAMRDALQKVGSVVKSDRIVINVLGGDDLQLPEVMDALHYLVVSMAVDTKAKIFFNSLCHSSIPAGTTTVTVVAFPHVPVKAFEGDADLDATKAAATTTTTTAPLTGLWPATEKAVAKGEVYAINGKWWTVVDEDVNPDLE